uniref:Uncharacterized protein LOC105057712 isoform X1 n=1 Tax=Elaeis guineensis var. tenera TaxID=51953 RepID=A0A8N4FDA8_ELAGV|nr:uncharacterized protein LOC105057712 isoform X1 [Elaeis guineensis]
MVIAADISGWTDLLHSTKLLEQAVPSARFLLLQRNLHQLESLSKNLKIQTLRAEAPSQSISAPRQLLRLFFIRRQQLLRITCGRYSPKVCSYNHHNLDQLLGSTGLAPFKDSCYSNVTQDFIKLFAPVPSILTEAFPSSFMKLSYLDHIHHFASPT